MDLETLLRRTRKVQLLFLIGTTLITIVVHYLSGLVTADKDRKSQARIEEANVAASQAQLELEELKRPRTIPPENREKIIATLKQFKGQKFSFTVFQNSEAMRFLHILNNILESAGWIRIPFQLDGMRIKDIAGNTAGITINTGLFASIGPDNPGALHALAALKEALDNEGFHCLADWSAEQLRDKTPRQ